MCQVMTRVKPTQLLHNQYSLLIQQPANPLMSKYLNEPKLQPDGSYSHAPCAAAAPPPLQQSAFAHAPQSPLAPGGTSRKTKKASANVYSNRFEAGLQASKDCGLNLREQETKQGLKSTCRVLVSSSKYWALISDTSCTHTGTYTSWILAKPEQGPKPPSAGAPQPMLHARDCSSTSQQQQNAVGVERDIRERAKD